jgi:uncharacterized protein YgfB (UPF0149 family)
MMSVEGFAPELYGFWPERRVYGGEAVGGWSEQETRAAVQEYFLEIKSGEAAPGEELRVMLNQMTAEMREQFAAFVELRKAAETAAAQGGDEAAGKLARADLKAAVDAMGLIVRTLEKIDQLQRQLARDRELEAESREEAQGYAEAKAQLLRIIEERAEEKAALIVEERLRALEAAGHDGISANTGNGFEAAASPTQGSGVSASDGPGGGDDERPAARNGPYRRGA